MNYNDENLLDMVELYANECGYIASAQELSDLFDGSIAPVVIKQYCPDDVVAMSEAFNNWVDSLCKDGEIHPAQYNDYCYVGKYV